MPYKCLVFTNEQDAINKNNIYFERLALHYPEIHNNSSQYTTIIKHYSLNFWAVYLDVLNFPLIITQQEIDDSVELTNDWFVPIN